MNDILLHTDQLTVGYHGEALIRDITFSVRAGQILTLIGPNGAGKSTILKSISRQLAPLAGTVFLQGKALTELPRQQLAQTMSILMTQRLETEWMRCIDVVESGRYPYTGRLGILSDDDRNIAQEHCGWYTAKPSHSGISGSSATDSASAFCWQKPSVRSRRC